MIINQSIKFMQRHGKFACCLLFLLLGTFASNTYTAAGQTDQAVGATIPPLSLKKSADKTKVTPGQNLGYTLEYKNVSLFIFPTVNLFEQVPIYTTFDPDNSTDGWICSGRSCQFPLGIVGPGAKGEVEFHVKVDAAIPAGVIELSNRAAIGVVDFLEIDTATEKTVLEAAPDLKLTKSDGGGATTPGNTITYQLTYSNQGNQGATGVVLTETVPPHTTFDNEKSSPGWDCSGSNCQFVVGTVASNATAAVDFAVKVVTPLPAGVTTIVNSATIADDGANGADPTPGNNSAAVTTPVNRTFSIVATKRDVLAVDADGDDVPSPGDTIAYTIQIRNNSNAGARNLIFSDTLDPNSTLVPGVQSTQGQVTVGNGTGDNRVEVVLGDLAGNGATATIQFSVLVHPVLPLTVTAIQNQGIVRSDDFVDVNTDDPDTGESNDATRTALRAFAQFQATLIDYLFVDSDGNDVVSFGDILIYRLTLDNTGNRAAGEVQIVDLPNLGLDLLTGTVATSWGIVVQGNQSGQATVRVDMANFPAGERVLVSYQMRVVEGVEGVIQNQASISAQTGLPDGTGPLMTDDPDVAGNADVTVTPLGSSLPKLQMLFLPLTAK